MLNEPKRKTYSKIQVILMIIGIFVSVSFCIFIQSYKLLLAICSFFIIEQILLWQPIFSKIKLLGKLLLLINYIGLYILFNQKGTMQIIGLYPFLITTLLVIIIYFTINLKNLRLLLSRQYIKYYSTSLALSELGLEMFSLLCIPVGEELLFRSAFFSYFAYDNMIKLISGIIVFSFLFVISHYLSPWGFYVFGFRDLCWLFALSVYMFVIKGFAQNELYCIIIHMLFNLPMGVSLFLRYRIRKE